MQKILLFLGLLLIDEMFHDNTIVQAIMPYPYFRHQRYPIRENSQQPLLVVHAVPITDMDEYISETTSMARKRSQPDNNFDYIYDFDPTQIFL